MARLQIQRANPDFIEFKRSHYSTLIYY